MTQTRAIPGAQSIDRATALLRWIAAGHASGTALRELVQRTGLDRTTAWRIVSSLEQQGLVSKDADSGLYHLGIEAMALGATCMERSPLTQACRPVMKTLVRLSGDSVFLVVRSGDSSYCVHLEEGVHPVRSFALNVGGTRLLGLGVASIALLATLSDEALVHHYARHRDEYADHDVGLPKLQRWVSQTRQRGHSHIHAGGVAGVGLQFRMGSCGNAAMSIIGPKSRLPRSRVDELAQAMRHEIRRVLPQLTPDSPQPP
ncbi:IclR family transcriptional regulator [Variovorax sp. EBFNA2]|uniref:IclR family transcriptional regulator n=1 Tax=Variovorax sp. EBFNA2 TaxID=3342097 RepID=UPI0029C0C681|nr:IclR family transcriptional regulator [Variovorax boronicumulans]WPG40111.1 IclR family transcriptional regulator [Variovorax boronicumulans]